MYKTIRRGDAIYAIDDFESLLESMIQENVESDEEYGFYVALKRFGEEVFFDEQYKIIVSNLIDMFESNDN